jgi:hypothetical protein
VLRLARWQRANTLKTTSFGRGGGDRNDNTCLKVPCFDGVATDMVRPIITLHYLGRAIKRGNKYCKACAPAGSRENLIEAAKDGRVATISAKAPALRSATQRRQAAALKAWSPADKPEWLDEKIYREKIQPRLTSVTVSAILSALDVSEPYAANIRAGRCIPHPRHWFPLAKLTGVKSEPLERRADLH